MVDKLIVDEEVELVVFPFDGEVGVIVGVEDVVADGDFCEYVEATGIIGGASHFVVSFVIVDEKIVFFLFVVGSFISCEDSDATSFGVDVAFGEKLVVEVVLQVEFGFDRGYDVVV